MTSSDASSTRAAAGDCTSCWSDSERDHNVLVRGGPGFAIVIAARAHATLTPCSVVGGGVSVG